MFTPSEKQVQQDVTGLPTHSNAPVSQTASDILSCLNQLDLQDKEAIRKLYHLLRNASPDDIAHVFAVGGIQTLVKSLKQEDRGIHVSFDSSSCYASALILAAFFWNNTTYQVNILETLLQHDTENPKPNALTLLQRTAYDSTIKNILYKTMYQLQHRSSFFERVSYVRLLNLLLIARDNFLKTGAVDTFSLGIWNAHDELSWVIKPSAYGTVKRFFTQKEDIKQQLNDIMDELHEVNMTNRALRKATINPIHCQEHRS